ncbi:hypothetical protein E2C01_096453 [Portunus trituberculatus]|uniref:Uncharacterized protein n=1 Tax=Portunus trituberculatus TaxID=210409 RepID=A0A5B7K310_PORTR|nr:hypothetical protein [Portunus trituberculatus]
MTQGHERSLPDGLHEAQGLRRPFPCLALRFVLPHLLLAFPLRPGQQRQHSIPSPPASLCFSTDSKTSIAPRRQSFTTTKAHS